MYHDKTKSGSDDGFVVTKLSDNKYRIVFFGNDETSRERANDFVLLRAAEETLSNGYEYLVIVRSKLRNSKDKFSRQTSTIAPIKVIRKDGSIIYTRDYVTQFGTSSKKYATTRPEVNTTIELYGDNYDQDKEFLVAKEIIRTLSKKYQITSLKH